MTQPWMRWLLVASLSINLLVAGAVLAALVQGRTARTERAGGPPEIALLIRALDRDDRGALLRKLRATDGIRTGRDSMAAARARMIGALRSETFDRAAFEAALTEQQAIRGRLSAHGIPMIAAFVGSLSEEERAALARALRRRR
ncbi:periplasmic heavy metal sensor [Jannaschia sp. S6380]|uniref:periplasmic heavy metal sensor n=1 Tax=Jannaschia sp. S6380 TaxID=2926408 RepID=UPI001FF6C7F5|nr:periplasmic heavy metal sensor [Jannaschia sp. S6380]MCK0167431.1 periplasmic heavy metal sensor [Jannaschia sp. S6380]